MAIIKKNKNQFLGSIWQPVTRTSFKRLVSSLFCVFCAKWIEMLQSNRRLSEGWQMQLVHFGLENKSSSTQKSLFEYGPWYLWQVYGSINPSATHWMVLGIRLFFFLPKLISWLPLRSLTRNHRGRHMPLPVKPQTPELCLRTSLLHFVEWLWLENR